MLWPIPEHQAQAAFVIHRLVVKLELCIRGDDCNLAQVPAQKVPSQLIPGIHMEYICEGLSKLQIMHQLQHLQLLHVVSITR